MNYLAAPLVFVLTFLGLGLMILAYVVREAARLLFGRRP